MMATLKRHVKLKHLGVLLLIGAIFTVGWGAGHGFPRDKPEKAKASSGSASTSMERTQAVKAKATYNRLKNSYRPFSSQGEFLEFTRGICLEKITHREICMGTPINMNKKLSVDGVAYFFLADEGNTATSIDFHPAMISAAPATSAFIIVHEWSHLELALITGNTKGYNAMLDRAMYYYKMIEGKPITRNRAMEVQTDCMALMHAKQDWIGGYPGYLRGVGKDATSRYSYDAQATCKPWQDVLYGDPTVNYKAGATKQ